METLPICSLRFESADVVRRRETQETRWNGSDESKHVDPYAIALIRMFDKDVERFICVGPYTR